jgi:hypothetical protein
MAQEFRDYIFQNSNPMRLNGKEEFNGTMFFEYTENLVKQINEGALPNLKSTYEYLSETKSH